MKTKLILSLAAVMALTVGVYTQLSSRQAQQNQARDMLPEFSFPDIAGNSHSISEWRGKVRVINFWATWCPPCRKEIPEFIAVQQQKGPLGLQFIGIAIEEQQPVDEYLDFIDINYPMLIAEDAGIELSQRLGNIVNTVPFTVVVDREGNIVHRQFGEFSKKRLLEVLNPLL